MSDIQLDSSQKRKLRGILVKLVPDESASRMIVSDAEIRPNNIQFSSIASNNWFAIIREADNQGKLGNLIEAALGFNPDNPELKAFHQEVMGATSPTTPTPTPVTPTPAPSPIPPPDSGSSFNPFAPQTDTEPTPVSGISGKSALDTSLDPDKRIAQIRKRMLKLVGADKTDEAIEMLGKIAPGVSSDYEESVILISARYNRLTGDKEDGVISDENYQLGLNKINQSVLNLVSKRLKLEIETKGTLGEIDKLSYELFPDPEQAVEILKDREIEVAPSGFEKIMKGKDMSVNVALLRQILDNNSLVGKISFTGQNTHEGTGFLLKGGYVLTNHHIFEPKPRASRDQILNRLRNTFIEFPLDPMNPSVFTRFSFEENFLLFSPAPAHDIINPDKDFLDYALLKLKEGQNLPQGQLKIGAPHNPSTGDPVFIIQFPGGAGGQQKVALVDNNVISEWEHYLYYEADTKGGASGSPIFNSSWEVVGLHHYGNKNAFKVSQNGNKLPANRGIYIQFVLKDIKAKATGQGMSLPF